MTGVTRGDLEVLAAYVESESVKIAAHRLGCTTGTVKNRLSSAYGHLGTTNVIGALKALGWLRARSHGMGL